MNLTLFSRYLIALNARYRLGELTLSEWSQRAEYLVDDGHELLSSEQVNSLLDWIYIVEDINALTLDERRQLNGTEADQVVKAMMEVDHLVLPYSSEFSE
jgi:hypothetical protein